MANKFCSRACKAKSMVGKKHPLFTRKGLPSPRKGVKFSDVLRKKISDAHKGIRMSEGAKKKLSETNKRLASTFSYWKGGISRKEGYKAFIAKRRRARKLGNGGFHTIGDWETLKAQYNFTCPSCKKTEPEIKLSQDHIIPLSKGGSDNIENIQPLCLSCNLHKMTKIIKY